MAPSDSRGHRQELGPLLENRRATVSHATLTLYPDLGSPTWTMASPHFSHPGNKHLKHPLSTHCPPRQRAPSVGLAARCGYTHGVGGQPGRRRGPGAREALASVAPRDRAWGNRGQEHPREQQRLPHRRRARAPSGAPGTRGPCAGAACGTGWRRDSFSRKQAQLSPATAPRVRPSPGAQYPRVLSAHPPQLPSANAMCHPAVRRLIAFIHWSSADRTCTTASNCSLPRRGSPRTLPLHRTSRPADTRTSAPGSRAGGRQGREPRL